MAPKKAPKTQETVRIDSLQAQYLRYISKLTGVPIAQIVRDAIEEWLDVKYSTAVRDAEKEHGLLNSTSSDEKPKNLHKAFDHMLKNLEALEKPTQFRHFAAKA